MDSTKAFSSHGRPPSTKYAFGKVNMPGGLKESPRPETARLNVEVKKLNGQTISLRDNVDFSDQRMGKSSNLPETSLGLLGSSNIQLDAKSAPSSPMSRTTSVGGSVYEKIDRLKTILDENKKSKNADEVWKPKQPAINTARIASEINQLEVVEAERRKATILQTQSSLLAQIVADTQQKLRAEATKEVQDDIARKYAEIARQHKAEIESELIKDLTPEVTAVLRTELEGQVKQELYTEIENSTSLREEVKRQLSIELVPLIKAELRIQLTDQMRREVYAKIDANTSARQAEIMPQLIKDMAPRVEATVRQECQEQMRREAYTNWNATMYELRDEVKDSLYKDLEPSVRASLGEALQEAVWVELRSELLGRALADVDTELEVYEIGRRNTLEKELTEKIRAELKENLRQTVELELRQEIKDAWAEEGNYTPQQPCSKPSQGDERHLGPSNQLVGIHDSYPKDVTSAQQKAQNLSNEREKHSQLSNDCHNATSHSEGSYSSQHKTAPSPEEHGRRFQSPAQHLEQLGECNDFPEHSNDNDLRLPQERTFDQRTKHDYHLSHSAYQHITQHHEDEYSQTQHQIDHRSTQHQSYNLLQEHARQQMEHFHGEKLSQLQYDNGYGSSEQGFSSAAEEHPKNGQSSRYRIHEGSLNPVCGSNKKRRHTLDDHDDDHYSDNGYHDKKRRRSEADRPHPRAPKEYLSGQVLGMSQPKAPAPSACCRMKPPADTLECEVEDIYGPGPMRPQDYVYNAGNTFVDQYAGQGDEEGEIRENYASSGDDEEDFDENEPDLATDNSESGLEDEESEDDDQEQLVQRQLIAAIAMDQEINNRTVSGCSADDPIDLESSDDENNSTGDEQWDQERTLVEDSGDVGAKGYLAKEEDEEL